MAGPDARATLRASMAYVRTRLGRLFFEEFGEAKRPGDPTIVLLHGLLFDGSMWKSQIAPLAALGRVLVFDGPGHGRSEPPPRFMMEEHADALYDAFGELGVARAIVIGLSWGGMVGMRLALQHPKNVAGLALLDASAETQSRAERIRFRAFISMHRRIGIPPFLFHAQIATQMFGPRTLRERPDLVLESYRKTSGFDREGVARASLAVVIHRTNVLDRLPSIRVPTVVIVGRDDKATPLARSQAIASKIAGSKLVVVEDAGHMTALECPEAVNAELVPFVVGAIELSRAHGQGRSASAVAN